MLVDHWPDVKVILLGQRTGANETPPTEDRVCAYFEKTAAIELLAGVVRAVTCDTG